MDAAGTRCLSDALLARFLDGEVTEAEKQVVLEHISHCEICFGVYASVIYNEKHPFSAADEASALALSRVDRAQFLEQTVKKAGSKIENAQLAPAATTPRISLSSVLNWRFLVPTIAALVLILYFGLFFTPPQTTDLFAEFAFDSRVPYPYLESTLRGGALEEQDPLAGRVDHNFRLAIADYLVRNYEGSLAIFHTMEADIRALARKAVAPQKRKLVYNYYFYRGLTHLARATSQEQPLQDTERAAQLAAAVEMLEVADSLAQAIPLPKTGREAFFLGLTYALQNDTTRALVYLRRLEPSAGELYTAGRTLLQKLERPEH